MKFRLPRPMIEKSMYRVISREIRKQKIEISRATHKQLQEIASACRAMKERGLPDFLVCKKLPGKLGFGIFLHPKAKPLKKDQIIAPYSGRVSIVAQNAPGDSAYAFAPIFDMILTKQEQTLFDPKRKYHPKRLYTLDIDAEKEGNFTRFINHASLPNVVAHLFKISHNRYGLAPSPIEVIYAVKKTIRPGQQLLVCYEGDDPSYWNSLGVKPMSVTPNTFRLSPALKIVK